MHAERTSTAAYLLAGLRSWIHLLLMGSTMLFYASGIFIVALFRRGEPIYRIGVAWLDVCISSARWLLGIDYRVHGLQNVPAQGPEQGRKVIVLCKHQSTYDTFVMPLILRKTVLAYVFKKELLSIPVFGWGLGRMDMIYIDRSQGTKAFQKVLRQGRALLGQGNWVIMFPEGTRVGRGKVGNYKTSGVKLAIEENALVLPVAITSARCWGPRAIVKYPGVVDVSFGPTITVEGRTHNEVIDEVELWIEGEMRRLDPQAYGPDAVTGSDAAA